MLFDWDPAGGPYPRTPAPGLRSPKNYSRVNRGHPLPNSRVVARFARSSSHDTGTSVALLPRCGKGQRPLNPHSTASRLTESSAKESYIMKLNLVILTLIAVSIATIAACIIERLHP